MAALAKCAHKSRIECVHIDMRTSVARQQCKRVRGRWLRHVWVQLGPFRKKFRGHAAPAALASCLG
jgi:hypothetical protein